MLLVTEDGCPVLCIWLEGGGGGRVDVGVLVPVGGKQKRVEGQGWQRQWGPGGSSATT